MNEPKAVLVPDVAPGIRDVNVDLVADGREIVRAREPMPVAVRDLAQFAKTGCRGCHGAGYVVKRAHDGKTITKGTKLGAPEFQRCACTERGLARAGLRITTHAGKPVWGLVE